LSAPLSGQLSIGGNNLDDLKAKGATDMYRAGVSIEHIQQLLGHESVTTTEVYIKARLPDISMPNMRVIKQNSGTD
jgi:integrase